ncbi:MULTISPECIES: hypothetical protein [Streptomyces]|uniref:hypothetical protein n=1 Tax=Streptomyces TaxID=1883 RepID=UPI0029314E30|nr:hypothetical protein [Streptomyces sp. NEAU-HV9]
MKEKGPSVVVMLGLISGGSWWLHDHLAQQSRLDATRSACRQAQDAWSDHATAGTGSDKSMSIKIDRRYAQELSLAASSARDPKIARELRNDADDIKAFADAYERGTSDAMSAAWSADTHDHGLWWTDCTVVLNSK